MFGHSDTGRKSQGEDGLQLFKEKKQSIIDTSSNIMNVGKEETNGYNHVTLPVDYMQSEKNAGKQTHVVASGNRFTQVLNQLKEMDDKNKDLDKYSSVQRNVSAIAALLGESLPMPKKDKKGKYTKTAIQEAKAQLDGSCAVMSFMYNKLAMSIDAVLGKEGNDSPFLSDALTQLKEAVEEERKVLQDRASHYLSYMVVHPKEQPEGGCTWLNALEFARTQEYDVDNKDYSINQDTTGGTSEIYHITNKKNNENLWFLKEHLVPSQDDAKLVKKVIDTHKFTSFNDDAMGLLRKEFDAVYVNRKTAQKNQFLILINATYEEHQDVKGFMSNMIKSLNSSKDKVYNDFGTYLGTLNANQKTDMFHLLDHLLREGNAKYNATMAPSGTKIRNGKSFNKRDVATSRMAQLFGVKDLFCTSRLASIRQNGKLIRGSIMENAEGESLNHYANHGGHMSFSSTALTQFAIVQMMDAICGQTDRHYDNMNAVIKNGDVKTIKCFDNNMSFGGKTYESYRPQNGEFKFVGNVKPVDHDIIKALPRWFVNRIYNMRLEALEIMLCDLLDHKEISALWGRIKGAQAHIAEVYDINFESRKKEMESGNYKDQILKCPEGMDEDDTLRLLKAFKNIAAKESLEEITNIPAHAFPTAESFGIAIEDRDKQLTLGQKEKDVSVFAPSKDYRIDKLFEKRAHKNAKKKK